MLYLVSFDEQRYTRRMDSFQPERLEYIVEFDVSLTGAGILWYKRLTDGTEVSMGGSAVDLRGLEFGSDSSYQNTAEYIGCIIGMAGLVLLGVRDTDIEIRGDSVAALTWAETERPRGYLVTNASMVFTLLSISFGLDVKKGVHISGEENWRCDRLSRIDEHGGKASEVLDEMGLGETAVVNLQDNIHVQKLLAGCHPGRSLEGEEVFLHFWGEVRDALKEIERSVHNSFAPISQLPTPFQVRSDIARPGRGDKVQTGRHPRN